MNRETRLIFSLFVLFFSFQSKKTIAQNVPFESQTAEVKNVRQNVDAIYQSAKGILILMDVSFKYSLKQLKPDTTSPVLTYHINLRLKKENYILSDIPSSTLTDSFGRLRISKDVSLWDVHDYKNITFFIPYCAIKTDTPFVSNVIPELQVYDSKGNTISTLFKAKEIKFTKPATKLVKVFVKDILVSALDYKNESWDFALTNPNGQYPEVMWEVIIGDKTVFYSAYENDNLEYTGFPDDLNDSFTLPVCEGDKFDLEIVDHDNLSFNDYIGDYMIDIKNKEFATGKMITKKLRKVERLEFSIDIQN